MNTVTTSPAQRERISDLKVDLEIILREVRGITDAAQVIGRRVCLFLERSQDDYELSGDLRVDRRDWVANSVAKEVWWTIYDAKWQMVNAEEIDNMDGIARITSALPDVLYDVDLYTTTAFGVELGILRSRSSRIRIRPMRTE